MDRGWLNEYVKTYVRKGFLFDYKKVLHEEEDLILWELGEKKQGEYKMLYRKVFLISVRSSTNSDNGWITFSPTRNHCNKFPLISEKFKELWNSNLENKGDLL